MTAEQIAANRKSAVQLVRITLNLNSRAPSDWTYDERIAYNKALADFIAQHPQDFSEQDAVNAASVQAKTYAPLEDTSVAADFATFGEAIADNALAIGDSVADVGRGVTAALSSMKWLIPVVVIGGGLFLAWRYANAVPVPSARKAKS